MITSKQAYDKFGDPATTHDEGTYMVMWDVPASLEVGVIPQKLYCNKQLVAPLSAAFKNLIDTGCVKELKTFDGCFNIRNKRGLSSASLHSWGLAIDVNAFENQLNMQPKLSREFVKCFTVAGFDWGGVWTRKDGMHFQLKELK
jgi:hypothetical protein